MLDVFDCIATQAVHILIIPNFCVQFHQTLRADLAFLEEVFVLVLFEVTLVNVDGQDYGTGCDH